MCPIEFHNIFSLYPTPLRANISLHILITHRAPSNSTIVSHSTPIRANISLHILIAHRAPSNSTIFSHYTPPPSMLTFHYNILLHRSSETRTGAASSSTTCLLWVRQSLLLGGCVWLPGPWTIWVRWLEQLTSTWTGSLRTLKKCKYHVIYAHMEWESVWSAWDHGGMFIVK